MVLSLYMFLIDMYKNFMDLVIVLCFDICRISLYLCVVIKLYENNFMFLYYLFIILNIINMCVWNFFFFFNFL